MDRPRRFQRVRQAVGRCLVIAAFLSAAAAVGACGSPVASPTRSLCDGVSATLGGCDADQPSFAGTSCAEVGAEWGTIVDARLLDVIHGPETVGDEARSVRLHQAMGLSFVRAAQHMDAAGFLATCRSAEFLGAAEPRFSPELRSSVGGAMYDGLPVVSYTEFLTDALRVVGTLDTP
jgi:hypothetical protein